MSEVTISERRYQALNASGFSAQRQVLSRLNVADALGRHCACSGAGGWGVLCEISLLCECRRPAGVDLGCLGSKMHESLDAAATAALSEVDRVGTPELH